MSVEYLTADEAADRLKVSVGTVLRWLNAERIKGTKFPGRAGWRISMEEVDRILRDGIPEKEPPAEN